MSDSSRHGVKHGEAEGGGHFIVSSSAKIISAQIAIMVVSVSFSMYLARLLPKQAFATFVVFGILSGLVSMVSNLGLETTVVQRAPSLFTSGRRHAAVGLVRTAVASRVVVSALAVAFLGAIAGAMATQLLHSSEYGGIVLTMLPGVWLLGLVDSLKLCLQADGRFGATSIADLVSAVLMTLASIAGYLLAGLSGYFLGIALGPAVECVLLGWWLRQSLLTRGAWAPWHRMVRDSWPFYVRGYLRYGLNEADKVVVAVFLPSASLAGYGIARKFADYLNLFGESVTNPILVRIARRRDADEGTTAGIIERVSRFGVLLIIPPCLLVALASPWLVPLYGGAKYAEAWPLLAILATGQALYFLSSVYGGSAVFGLGQPIHTLLQDGLPGVVNTAASLALISLFGIWGMAWSQLVAYASALVLSIWLMRRFTTARPDYKAWRVIGPPLVGAAAVFAAGQVLFDSLFSGALVALSATAVYAMLAGRRLLPTDWLVLKTSTPPRVGRAIAWAGRQRVFSARRNGTGEQSE